MQRSCHTWSRYYLCCFSCTGRSDQLIKGWDPGSTASLETPGDLLFCTDRGTDRCLATDCCFTNKSLSGGTLISGDGRFQDVTNGFCALQMLRSVAILRLWIRSAINSFILSIISQWQKVTACFHCTFLFLDCFNLDRIYMKSMQKSFLWKSSSGWPDFTAVLPFAELHVPLMKGESRGQWA